MGFLRTVKELYTSVLCKIIVKLFKSEGPKHHKLAVMQQVRSIIYSITNKSTAWKRIYFLDGAEK